MTAELIEKLGLEAHKEGGHYKRMYESPVTFKRDDGKKRSTCTSIYYYLDCTDFSAWHRLVSDEQWYFHCGSSLTIHLIDSKGELSNIRLGNPVENEDLVPQCIVPAGTWFSAEVDCDNSFALSSCVVSPGFDWKDFELAKPKKLIEEYPQHEAIINRLTR